MQKGAWLHLLLFTTRFLCSKKEKELQENKENCVIYVEEMDSEESDENATVMGSVVIKDNIANIEASSNKNADAEIQVK